ncbi:hypothetical protein MATL_G00170300 [Megalops atlanticus]|uniref:Uncharacterized protein n=1 Tax=Megalops atlanticus TaxID=7932 RepID=A0A9D3PSZ3_MEGAT|nr:hypothetical protein MATL_G00170300 [Megalops atlanticus]
MIAPALFCIALVCLCHSSAGYSAIPETASPPGPPWTPRRCQKLSFEKLSCCHLNLSSVPTGLDPRLRRLDVSNNMISDIGVVNLRFLEELDST